MPDFSQFGDIGTFITYMAEKVIEHDRLLKTRQTPADPEKDFYNIKEAAQKLNTSVGTIRRLIKRKLLNRALDTWTIRIPRESLEAYRKAVLSASGH